MCGCLWRSEVGFGSPPDGVIGGCELLPSRARNKLGSSWESSKYTALSSPDFLFLNKMEKKVLISLIALLWIKSYFHKM